MLLVQRLTTLEDDTVFSLSDVTFDDIALSVVEIATESDPTRVSVLVSASTTKFEIAAPPKTVPVVIATLYRFRFELNFSESEKVS